MRVLITGSGGMIGRKLAHQLTLEPTIDGRAITELVLADIVPTPIPTPPSTADPTRPPATSVLADLTTPDGARQLARGRPDLVFHLAGVVSGEAEADLAKGYRVNLDGSRNLFDALATTGTAPRVVFTSSIAVFGAPFPPVIGDDFHLTPLSSYGAQKAMTETLLADYTRRGLLDGVGIRLPTITVRPGAPNAAASGFYSSIIREPLAGEQAMLPVARSMRHVHASPQSAVGFLIHAAGLGSDALGSRPNLTMPSVSVTVGEQIEALVRVAGPAAAELIVERPDPAVQAIVGGWPERFEPTRALDAGFRCEADYDQIIQSYLTHDAP